MEPRPPAAVAAATRRAADAGFGYSCEPEVGQVLAVLAAGVPVGGHILELGSGTGVGTAWLTSGLFPRTDVALTTVECDAETARLAAAAAWPEFVRLVHGDALDHLTPASYDLIFADAPGGKWEGLDRTVGALRPGGLLVVDDMRPTPAWSQEQHTRQNEVRAALFGDAHLVSVELAHGSGIILSSRRG